MGLVVPGWHPGGRADAGPGDDNRHTMGADSRMQILRLGDRGPPWPTCRPRCRSLGLLPDGDGTAGPRPPQAMATAADVALDAAVFDAATELAVRHFQQDRGLSVDGRVGEETYRALNEARWSLGDRLLRYDPERPIRGDDVTSLQERLLELGYDAGRGRRHPRAPRPRWACAPSSATTG